MNLQDLTYFVTTAKCGTMQSAAELLHVSQSTLSMSLKRLESELGTKLFARTGRTMFLTRDGEVFLSGAEKLLSDAQKLMRSVGKNSAERSRPLTVAADAVDFAMESIKVIQRLYPDLSIRLLRPESADIPGLLMTRQADYAITLQTIPSDEIESQLLFSEPMYLMASADSPYASMQTASLSALRNETLIATQPRYALRNIFESYFTLAGFRPKSVLEVGDQEVMALQAAAGRGITFVPRCVQNTITFFRQGFRNPVCTRPMAEMFCYRNVYLCRSGDLPRAPETDAYQSAAELLRDFVKAHERYPEEGEV